MTKSLYDHWVEATRPKPMKIVLFRDGAEIYGPSVEEAIEFRVVEETDLFPEEWTDTEKNLAISYREQIVSVSDETFVE